MAYGPYCLPEHKQTWGHYQYTKLWVDKTTKNVSTGTTKLYVKNELSSFQSSIMLHMNILLSQSETALFGLVEIGSLALKMPKMWDYRQPVKKETPLVFSSGELKTNVTYCYLIFSYKST